MLALFFLGPFRAEIDGESLVPFRSSKAQALLIYLTVEHGQPSPGPVRREMLMELLWPGMPEASARQNLRQSLYLLRQELPPAPARDGSEPVALIVADRQTIAINPEAIYTSDLAAFKQLLGDGTIAALEEAVALYRGDFLEDFYLEDSNEFENWAAGHRAHWQRQMLRALETLAAHYLNADAYARAEEHARRQIALDPLREAAHRQLMEALARSGRRSAAIAAYERCRTLLESELDVDPTAETKILYEKIRADLGEDGPAVERLVQHPAVLSHIHSPARAPSLPHVLTPFFGRDEEMAQIKRWLQGPDNRLVTLVGPGGSGKTRLAIEAARALEGAFAHGVYFVSLAEIDDELFEATLASALGVSLPPLVAPERQLVSFLQSRELLLIVDNFEQSAALAMQMADWLRLAPDLRVLVTAREPLSVYGESLLRIEGLDSGPPAPAAATGEAAVALFINRARRVKPDLALTGGDRPHILRICRLLQGNPLAIELVAPWIRLLPPEEIEHQIRHNLDLFADSPHDRPPRHRSLRALFDYTWSRLDRREKGLLQELAVFRGEISLDAATKVGDMTLPTLAMLVDKSLLSERAPNRYEMHVHLRRYAREQPEEEPARVAAAARRHAAYFADYIGRRAGSLEGARALSMIEEITQEIDNVRAAWRWISAHRNGLLLFQMTVPLLLFYEIRGWYAEGHEQFKMASDHFASGAADNKDDTERLVGAYLLAVYGWFAQRLGHYHRTQELLEESLRLGRALSDLRLQAFVVSAQALVESRLGHVRDAERRAAESARLAEKVADPMARAFSLVNVGFTELFHGRYRRALEVYRTALEAFRSFHNDYGAAICLANLGHISMRLGEYDDALEACKWARQLCEGTGYQFGLGNTLRTLAEAWLAKGDSDQAERYAVQSLKLAEEIGDREGYGWAELVLGRVAEARGDHAAAQQLFVHSSELFRELTQTLGIAEALARLGELSLGQGEHGQAVEQIQKAWSLYERLGHDEGMARTAAALGEAYLQKGAGEKAADQFQLALTLARDSELPPLKIAVLVKSAQLLLPEHPLSASRYLRLSASHPATEQTLRAESLARLRDLGATLPRIEVAAFPAAAAGLDAEIKSLLRRISN